MGTIEKYLKREHGNLLSLTTDDINPYLNDQLFDQGLFVNITTNNIPLRRQEAIIENTKNKNVIHVGCVDHLEIIEDKIEHNTWLHSKIIESSSECIGIDINKKGIDYLKNKLKIDNVYYCDLIKNRLNKLMEKNWDIMVLGEIVEHVTNPQEFLSKIFSLYKYNVNKIIITVPNVYCYNNYRNAKRGIEVINSDHKTVFSPYTLVKTLNQCGFKTDQIFFADPTYKIWHRIMNKVFKTKFFRNKKTLSNTIVALASFK